MVTVAVTEVVDVVESALAQAGADANAATTTAEAICYAEASGIASHGLVRAGPLADQLGTGKINGAAQFRVERAGESVSLIDADFGLGYVAAARATEVVAEMLKQTPVAIAAVSRSHHFGVAGLYAERLAEAGFVGLVVSGTFGALAPIGGRTALLGNPPIALAVPQSDDVPIVVDLAPAVVARGNIVAAARRGELIPPGWALDGQGNPTQDPHQALQGGTLRAIGDGKGVLLAMLADLLIVALTRSNLPGEASSVFTVDGPPPGLGHVILGIDPAGFGMLDSASRVASYMAMLVEDSADMRVPGQRRREARAAAEVAGVSVDDETWLGLLKRREE